jgi:hypothetical protein
MMFPPVSLDFVGTLQKLFADKRCIFAVIKDLKPIKKII